MPTPTPTRPDARVTGRDGQGLARAILDALPSGVCVIDGRGRVVMVNRTWRRFAGSDAGRWNRVQEGEDYLAACEAARAAIPAAAEIAEALRSVLAGERSDFHLEHADDGLEGRRWFVVRVTRLSDEGGAGAVVTRFDVTKRREVEEEVSAERDFVDAVLGTTRALVAVSDREGCLVRFNRACEEASGRAFAEVRGKRLWDLGLLSGEDAAEVRDRFAQVLEGGAPGVWENDWCRRDGTRRRIVWSSVGLAAPDGAVGHVVSSGIDVTAQREAEARADERQEELVHLHRLHTAGELAATLAHELGQPLAAIAAYAESSLMSIAAHPGTPATVATNLQKIARQALRAGEFVNEMRGFVTKGESERRAEDLARVVRAAAEMVAPLSRRRRVRIRFDLDAGLPPVRVTEVQVEHVVVNLVRNAIDAIGAAGHADGEVTVRTRGGAPGLAVVSVIDSGPGVAAGDLDRVFEAFYTTRPEGLGMGLRISRSIVEAHGGRLWAEPGPGGRFFFTLETMR